MSSFYFLDYWWQADDTLGNWVTVGVYSSHEKAQQAHRKQRETDFHAAWPQGAPEQAKAAFEEKLFDGVRKRSSRPSLVGGPRFRAACRHCWVHRSIAADSRTLQEHHDES